MNNASDEAAFRNVQKRFEEFGDYLGAADNARKCAEKADEAKAAKEKADREAEERRKAALEAAEEARKKRTKMLKKVGIACCILAVVGVTGFFIGKGIINHKKYSQAVSYAENKEYLNAYNTFIELGDYKDSAEKADKLKICLFNIGDVVQFGKYEWYVIKVNDDSITLLSKHIIESKNYYPSSKCNNNILDFKETYCYRYLVNDYYNELTSEEQSMLLMNKWDNGIESYAYLLSVDEAKEIDKDILACENFWWLGTLYETDDYRWRAAYVNPKGEISDSLIDSKNGIRPTITVKAEALDNNLLKKIDAKNAEDTSEAE